MPEDTNMVENATQGEPAEPERTFTQAEMEAIIGERLRRERQKYANFDEIKAKAEQFDAAQEAAKSDFEKAVEERDKYKNLLESLQAEKAHADAVAKAAAEYGVSAELLMRMGGDVDENAAFLKKQMENQPKYGQVLDGGESQPPTVTRESIEAIKDPVERVRARAQHQELFE